MTVGQRIEAILGAMPDTRNSDAELWLVYAYKSGLGLSKEQERIFRDMPSFETIRRTRQKLQEQGKYPANDNVRTVRQAKAANVRTNITNAVPGQVIELTDGLVNLGNGKFILPFGQ